MEVTVQKGLLTTNSLVQPLHTEMADEGAFTVYTATFKVFEQGFCKGMFAQLNCVHVVWPPLLHAVLQCFAGQLSTGKSK